MSGCASGLYGFRLAMRFAERFAFGPGFEVFLPLPACADRYFLIILRVFSQQHFQAEEAFHFFHFSFFIEAFDEQMGIARCDFRCICNDNIFKFLLNDGECKCNHMMTISRSLLQIMQYHNNRQAGLAIDAPQHILHLWQYCNIPGKISPFVVLHRCT